MSKLWRQRLLILLGLLVAYALRVYKLGDQNIWWDEGLSVLAARKSFAGVTLWTAADVHPPLYFWLLWLWARLMGETEFALRYVTVIESLLTVAVMFPLGRRLSRKPLVGIGALWLLGLSRFHVWWSQEMRMYILASLCSMLSLYFVTRLTAERPSRRDRVGWVLATAGALYTIYSSVVLLVIENLFMLAVGLKRRDRRKFWGHWLLNQLVVALGVLPWLMLALPRMRSWSVVQEPASLRFVLELDAVLLSLGISTDVGHYALPAALVMASVALGVFLLLRQRQGQAPEEGPSPQGLLLLGLSVLLPPLVIWVLTQPRAIFYTPRVEARYLLPFAPAFYLLLAWSLAGWLRSRALRPVGIAIGISLLGLAAWSLPQHYAPRYLRDDFQTLTRQIWAYARPGDAVVLVSGNRYPLFDSYYDRTPAPPDRPPVYRIPDGQPALTSTVADEILKDIAA
ncbi:MAG: glycosyltransferase family 39 protein, partial [Anaerolineae bacterium]|nr:glycosyltransferase family 39 protein [Anaerolineae bacterium]